MHTDVGQRAFRAMSRQEGQFALLLDADFNIIWQSDTLRGVLGYADVVGRNGTEFIHPDDLELALATIVRVNDDRELFRQDDARYAAAGADIRLRDSRDVWVTMEVTVFNYLDDPEVGAVLCTAKMVRDRSDVGRSIEMLATGAETPEVLAVVARLADRSVGESTRVAIAWRDNGQVFVTTPPESTALDDELARAAELVWTLDLQTPTIIDDLDDPRLQGLGAIAAAHEYRAAFLIPIEAPTGSEIIGAMVMWGRSTVDMDASMQAPIHVAVRLAALAIAESRSKRALRWAASHDPLTGLPNRAEFGRRLDAIAHTDIVLLYIDLDDFKPINDIYGHPVGDLVLVEVGRRITATLGPDDFVGRLGGDEFAVVCAHADLHRGRRVADEIVTQIRRPIRANGVAMRIGASVGVAVGAQPLIPSVLVQRADEALYAAKHSGKNTVRIAS